METDYIYRDIPMVCWTYRLRRARTPKGHDAPWAMTPIILEMFKGLACRREPIPALNVWAQSATWLEEHLIAVADTAFRGPAGPVIRRYLGSAKAKEPGLTLGLIQAPSRAPLLLNKLLVPIFRYDQGQVIVYRDPQPLLSHVFPDLKDFETIYRRWVRVNDQRAESYQSGKTK